MIGEIFSNILDSIVSIWELIESIIDLINDFIDLIPTPFNNIIKYSIPLFLICIVLKVKRAI